MKQIQKIACLILFISVFAGCKKSAPDDVVLLGNDKELSSFKLEHVINKDYIAVQVDGAIDKDQIKIAIPAKTDLSELIASFTFVGKEVLVNGVQQESGVTVNDYSVPVEYVVEAEDGSKVSYFVKIEKIEDSEPENTDGLKKAVPHIYIETGVQPIVITKDYTDGKVRIDGKGVYDDFEEVITRIKGRGNSTWGLAKKPYKLKLNNKASVLGLKESKEWVLLANHLDGTLMLNAVAMKIGHLLEFPNTNTMIPVDVTINGEYMGSYNFTEQVGVEENRVNIKDGGVLLELDTYYDEPFKFMSNSYNLPVMLKYPELEDSSPDVAAIEMDKIMSDFHAMEGAVFSSLFPNTNYLDLIDKAALVKYLIVYNLTDNEEINHPKSTYMHKPKGGKYIMGPLWDFDWAYGYEHGNIHFASSTYPLLWTGAKASKGTSFFTRMLTDPQIKQLYKQEWNIFRTSKFPELMFYIDEYAKILAESHKNNYERWKLDLKTKGSEFEGDVVKLKQWMLDRAAYIDTYVAGF